MFKKTNKTIPSHIFGNTY